MEIEDTPIACSLGERDFKERTVWLRQLASDHLLAWRRTPLTLRLTYVSAASEQIRDLVAREQACCPFLRFELSEDAEMVHLTVTAPEEARDAADLVFAHLLPNSAASSQPCY